MQNSLGNTSFAFFLGAKFGGYLIYYAEYKILVVLCNFSNFQGSDGKYRKNHCLLGLSKLPSNILTSKCGINERRATTLTHLFLFALLLTQRGDVEKNPGPIETIETVYGICSKNCANLKFVHLNFQSIIRKRMQLKKFFDDIGENTIIGISETWLKKEDSDNLWNLHPRTHAVFRYDRQSAVKKKGSGILLYIPVKLAPKLRPDLNLFDKKKMSQCGLSANLHLTFPVKKKC